MYDAREASSQLPLDKASISDFLGPNVVISKNLAIDASLDMIVLLLDMITYSSVGSSCSGRKTEDAFTSSGGHAKGPGADSQSSELYDLARGMISPFSLRKKIPQYVLASATVTSFSPGSKGASTPSGGQKISSDQGARVGSALGLWVGDPEGLWLGLVVGFAVGETLGE